MSSRLLTIFAPMFLDMKSRVERITPQTWKVICGDCGTWFVVGSQAAGFTWLEKHTTGFAWVRRHLTGGTDRSRTCGAFTPSELATQRLKPLSHGTLGVSGNT